MSNAFLSERDLRDFESKTGIGSGSEKKPSVISWIIRKNIEPTRPLCSKRPYQL